MTCATGLRGVGDERAAGAGELAVEYHGSSECGEAGAEADSEVVEGAGAVTFKREDVLCGPENRFDSLADRGQMRAASLLVLAAASRSKGAGAPRALTRL